MTAISAILCLCPCFEHFFSIYSGPQIMQVLFIVNQFLHITEMHHIVSIVVLRLYYVSISRQALHRIFSVWYVAIIDGLFIDTPS